MARPGPPTLAVALSTEKGVAVPPDRRAAVEVTVGPALYWDKAGWGTFSQDVSHVFATREVAGSGEIDIASAATMTQAMYHAALSILSGAALMPGCDALELRHLTVPGVGGPARIRMFVTAKTQGRFPVIAEAAAEAACAALPRGFEWCASQADTRIEEPDEEPDRPRVAPTRGGDNPAVGLHSGRLLLHDQRRSR